MSLLPNLQKLTGSELNALHISWNKTRLFEDIWKIHKDFLVDDELREAVVENKYLVDQFVCPCCGNVFTDKKFTEAPHSYPVCCFTTMKEIGDMDCDTMLVKMVNANNIVVLEHMLTLEGHYVEPNDMLDASENCPEASEATRNFIIEKVNEWATEEEEK